MIFSVFQIVSNTDNTSISIAQVWIDTLKLDEAMSLAAQALETDGWCMRKLIEITTTTKDDYFSPCQSLDAFLRAEQDGLAIRYS